MPVVLPVPRMELTHRRVTRFRAAVLVELFIGSVLTLCLLPLILAVLLLANALGLPLPGFDELMERAWTASHEIRLCRVDAHGRTSEEQVFSPNSAAEGDAVLQEALRRAAAAGLPLVERVGGQEQLALWAPERPLAEPAGGPDTAALIAGAEAAGYRVAREGDGLTLSAGAPKIPAAAAVVMLALSWPFAIGFEQGRRKLRELVEDLRGAPPEQITLRADPSGLRLRRERAGALREEASCPRARILGLAVLALPSYGERVRPMDARLYARGAPDFALALPGPGAEVVRKLLVRGILGELC